MQNIKDLSLRELEILLKGWGYPQFHARQIFSWMFKLGARDFQQLSNLSLGLRQQLNQQFSLVSLKLIRSVKSEDGTQKFLFELSDSNLIEAVTIPTEKRITGCISTQAGCKFSCAFCASGVTGFKRNLTTAEIIDQVLFLKNELEGRKLTHIVFMGTGEPLDNYDNVLGAIRIINSPEGLNIGARRITISTSGIIPGIKRLQEENLQIELSVSLHASDDSRRSQIMPVNKKYPLKDLIKACAEYIKKTNRQITFEYVLIKDLNSSLQSAQNLGKILKGLNCKVNIIPANPSVGCDVNPPKKSEILLFRDCLSKQGINVTLRRPRGQDIEAACGQLRLRHENK